MKDHPPRVERRQVTLPDGRRLTFYPLSEPTTPGGGAPAPAAPAPAPPPRQEG